MKTSRKVPGRLPLWRGAKPRFQFLCRPSISTAFAACAAVFAAATFAAGRALFVAFGLFFEHAVRQAELSRFLIDFEEFHADMVALLDAGLLDRFEAFPGNFADVEQAFAARHELNEASVGHDTHHLGVVDFADFRDGYDGADLGYGSVDGLLVRGTHLYDAYAVFLVVWGTLAVSSVDNFLKPILIARGTPLPLALVFLGVLGGLMTFGFLGLILGPVLLSIGMALLQAWLKRPLLAKQALEAPPADETLPAEEGEDRLSEK